MIIYMLIYLHSIKDNKPVNKSLEKYYTTMNMILIVLVSLSLLWLLYVPSTPIKTKLYSLVIPGGILALLLYNYIIINKGEHPDRGAIITNLIILYGLIITITYFFYKSLFPTQEVTKYLD
jgi:hypothetical protein